MKRLKKMISIILVLTLVFALCACGGNGESNETYKFRVAVQEAEGQPVADFAKALKASIEEKTEGKVELELFFAAQLGDYAQVYEEVQMGTIDIAIQSITTQFDDRYNITCLPYSTTNCEQWKTLWLPGGAGFNELSSYMDENGVKLLAPIDYGFMCLGFSNTKNGVDNAMDPTVKKNFLIRVPAMETYIKLGQEMGFNTTSIPYGDLYSSLQTGVADGVIGCPAMALWDSFRDVMDTVIDARYVCETGGCIMNLNTFNSMPQEYQDIFTEVFAEEAEKQANKMDELEKEYLKNMEDYGISVITPSQDELDTMAAHIQETVWPLFVDLIGQDKIDLILNAVSGL